MTYTQSSFTQDNADLFVVVKPMKKNTARKTVCIPEAVHPSAMCSASRSSEMPAPFTFVCIFLLCVAMLLLLIHSFSAIQETATYMSDLQQELDALKLEETSVQAKLNEKYGEINVEETAKQLGMVSSENSPRVPLDDADTSDTDRDALHSAFASFWASWSLEFQELQSYLK